MALRQRGGRWHYRFKLGGHEWSGNSGLEATERNRQRALVAEAKARLTVREGRANELRIVPQPFSKAMEAFIEWNKGEHREKPQTWKRIRGSGSSLARFFGSKPLSSLSVGDIEDYKAWRRTGEEGIRPVAEITLRHDLHTLSGLMQYGQKHRWCARNLVREVKIPGDQDAVRFHRITPAEEAAYFAAAARQSMALHDLGRLMILQGPRPTEVMLARCEDVDLRAGTWRIPVSKSKAGARTLYLVPEAVAIMERRLADAPPSGWLFQGKRKSSHLQDIENSHLKVLDATGLHFVIYDFRHTFASRMAENGCDIATIAKILGHANLRTVMRYVHVSDDHTREAMRKFGESVPFRSTINHENAQSSAKFRKVQEGCRSLIQ